MYIKLNKTFREISTIIDRLAQTEKSPISLHLEFDENKSKSKDIFDLKYLKSLIDAIQRRYPNLTFTYNVTYIKHADFHMDSNKCKKLEEINNFLIDNYNVELLLRKEAELDRSFTFQSVINANRQIDKIVANVKKVKQDNPSMSTFEQFMILYETVTDFIYKEEERYDQLNASHWISVINGDAIVCTGYASLMQELAKRIFKKDELLILENDVDVFDKSREDLISAHANNIIFIRDKKYSIKGLFYLDPCWDSVELKDEIKAYSYCCIPLADIPNHKFFTFQFRNVYRYNLEDCYNDFFDLQRKARSLKKLPIIKHFVTDEQSFYENKGSIQYYINNYEDLDNKSVIPLEAYANAFRIIGKQKGLTGSELERFIQERIEKSIAKTRYYFNVKDCKSSLANVAYQTKSNIR